MTIRVLRLIECLLLFVALPLVYCIVPLRLPKIPALLAFFLFAVLQLRMDTGFERSCLWRASAVVLFLRSAWPRVLTVLMGLTLLAYAWEHISFFKLPRERPGVWLLIMLLYPWLSAYPQEVIFRGFFFRRYGVLFGHGFGMVLASALAFAFLHIIYGNFIALAMSFAGGCLFACNYRRFKSCLAVALEHTIYGCWIFSVGLGVFFYGGR